MPWTELIGAHEFRGIDWTVITSDLMREFENKLLNSALVEALHDYGGFHDECPFGNQCPLHTDAVMSRRERIWGVIRNTYTMMKKKMGGGM